MNIEESELDAAHLIECRKFNEAERLLSRLSERGSVYALMALAWINEMGCTGKKDLTAAEKFYKLAILRDNKDAILYLGLLLSEQRHYREAREVLEQGAKKGHVGCVVELGWMLANGIGGEARKVEGRKMLEDASNRGHLFAQRRIISLDFSDNPSYVKRIILVGRLIGVAVRISFEDYRNKPSRRIW